MTIDQNTLRRLNKLWKDRHGHADDTTATELVEIRETISVGNSGAAVSPAYIHLTHNSGQTIAVAGEAISWDAQHPLIDPVGFANPADAGTDNLPVTTVRVPYDGYYGVKVELKWDSHTSGGTVEVRRTRNDNVVRLWPTNDDPAIWTATDGQIFTDIAIVPAQNGDLLSVYVDHDAGATKDLATAQVIFYKVESSTVVKPLYRSAVLAAGPRAYWRLDETSGTNADDIAGHSSGPHDGTYVGTPTLNQTGIMQDGSDNASVELNGSSQYVTVPLASVLGVTDMSIELWFNTDDAGALQALFAINDEDIAAGANRFVIWVNGTNKIDIESAAGGAHTGTTTLASDVTYCMVVTRTAAGALSLYLDGVLDSTDTGHTDVAATGDNVTVGMEYDNGPTANDYFNGHIDEVAVYGRVLGPDEVLEHYNIGRGAFL